MRALVVEADAETELAAALDWYEQQEPGLGAALLAEADRAIDGLRNRMLRGVRVPEARVRVPPGSTVEALVSAA